MPHLAGPGQGQVAPGQGLVDQQAVAGARREQNLFWQVLDMAVRPFTWAARRITPRMVLDRHVPLVAFLLLAFTWILVTLCRIQLCVQIGVHLCR